MAQHQSVYIHLIRDYSIANEYFGAKITRDTIRLGNQATNKYIIWFHNSKSYPYLTFLYLKPPHKDSYFFKIYIFILIWIPISHLINSSNLRVSPDPSCDIYLSIFNKQGRTFIQMVLGSVQTQYLTESAVNTFVDSRFSSQAAEETTGSAGRGIPGVPVGCSQVPIFPDLYGYNDPQTIPARFMAIKLGHFSADGPVQLMAQSIQYSALWYQQSQK